MTNKEIKTYFCDLAKKHKMVLSTDANPKLFKASILEIIEAQQSYEMDYCIVIESRAQKFQGNIDNGSKFATAAFYVLGNYDQFEDTDKESILDNCETIANDFVSSIYADSIKCPQVFPNFEIERVKMNEVKGVFFPNSLGYRIEYAYTYQQDLNKNEANWNQPN